MGGANSVVLVTIGIVTTGSVADVVPRDWVEVGG